jgi:CRISPR type III-A-associated RAMP protein Csm5
MDKVTGIIELETLAPLFIGGKESSFGEGFITVGKKTFLIDNDKLCQFIYEKTFDDNGCLKNAERDYVKWYAIFMSIYSDIDIVSNYNLFADFFNLETKCVTEFRAVPDWFKKKSIQIFLEKTGLLSNNAEFSVRGFAKGITILSEKKAKKYIQNGNGDCFIPGSSIKGVIRNAVCWEFFKDSDAKKIFDDFFQHNLSVGERKSDDKARRKFAEHFSAEKDSTGNTLNSISFSGKYPAIQDYTRYNVHYVNQYNNRWIDANEVLRDLFRIIKISDANFSTQNNKNNIKVNAYSLRKEGTPVFAKKESSTANLEAIVTGSKARFKITIDKKLANEFFKGNIPSYLTSIDGLLQVTDEYFRKVVSEEISFYGNVSKFDKVFGVSKWYDCLNNELQENLDMQLFRVGWGGGLMSKTQFLHLNAKDRTRVRNLTNNKGNTVAPKSRCLVANNKDEAVSPLGWCTLRFISSDVTDYPSIYGWKESVTKQARPIPPRCVLATILDVTCKPTKVIISQGDYHDIVTEMPGINVQGLGLTNGSEVFVELLIQKKRLIKADYKGKP